MLNKLLPFLFSIFFFTSFNKLFATHLRAGDITARKIDCNTKTYEFTITLYLDTKGVAQESLYVNFGDGSPAQKVDVTNKIGLPGYQDFQKNIYVVRHSYGADASYFISVGSDDNGTFVSGICCRNDGTVNLTDPLHTNFFIETLLTVNATYCNNTPQFLNPPTDKGRVGQKFTYDPTGFDIDGDSLSYSFVTPAQSRDRSKKLINVNGYIDPNVLSINGVNPKNELQTGPAIFTINPYTGLITWDAPAVKGQYNIAFIVTEWRLGADGKRVSIGYVRRDMQIIITECDNKRPTVLIPRDTCILANTILKANIKSTDPDVPFQNLTQTSFGGVYDFVANKATFTSPVQKSPATGLFEWSPTCAEVRSQPYTVVFKVEDAPGDIACKLSDTKAWNIKVVAQKDSLYSAVPFSANGGKSIKLTWAPYVCAGTDVSKLKVIVYRKKGCDNFKPGNCDVGMPASWGYSEISRDSSVIAGNYVDTKNLQKGVIYSYRIVIAFPLPGAGLSYVSNPICVTLTKDVPFITNVTVDSTDKIKGKITVKWTHPPTFNTTNYPGSYSYQVFRADGQNGKNYVPVGGRIAVSGFPNYSNVAPDFIRLNGFTGLPAAQDTTFIDSGLNTQDKSYNYQMALYYNTNTFKDSSAYASSVWLNTSPEIKSVKLTWQYDVPWDNSNQYHRIYKKDKNNVYKLIDSVKVNLPSDAVYIDKGLKDTALVIGKFYCYYVQTTGAYESISLNPPALLNNSEKACETVKDTTRPCPPKLSLDSLKCPEYINILKDPNVNPKPSLQNELSWTNQKFSNCDTNDIEKYRLYYTPYQGDTLKLLAVTNNKYYTHFNLINKIRSLSGCYAVTAVDRSGNESNKSNIICVDNCPNFELPNVITPDISPGENDNFHPYPVPAFVESVRCTIYNRWGKQVFEVTDNINIEWDGKVGIPDNEKSHLSSGVYYYFAEVKFITLRRQDQVRYYKGWIQVFK